MIERLLTATIRTPHNLMLAMSMVMLFGHVTSYGCVTDEFVVHNLTVRELTFETSSPRMSFHSMCTYSDKLYSLASSHSGEIWKTCN